VEHVDFKTADYFFLFMVDGYPEKEKNELVNTACLCRVKSFTWSVSSPAKGRSLLLA
jgi:hypothetical protein